MTLIDIIRAIKFECDQIRSTKNNIDYIFIYGFKQFIKEHINTFKHRNDVYNHESSDGQKCWYKMVGYSRIYHREDGPAIEYHNGSKEHWLNGIEIKYEQIMNNEYLKIDTKNL